MKRILLKLSLVLVSLLGGSLSSNAATYNIHDGWNLLGAPCDISVSHFEKPEVIAIWKWNGHKWLAHSPNEEISKLLTAYGISDFEEVKYLEGFWVNSEGDITIDVPECGTSNSTVDLTKGLVAYWSFDNCDARDDSGNGHDGTIHGNPECVEGIKGKGFYFNGNGDYIEVPLTPDIKFNPNLDSFTLVAWAKPIRANDTDGNCGCNMTVTPFIDTYTYYLCNSGIEGKRDYSAQGGAHLKEPYFDNSTWHLFVGVWQVKKKKATAKFYLDGKLMVTKDFEIVPQGQYPWYGLYIGATHHCTCYGLSYGEFFGDEIRIYNRALSEEEIKALYESVLKGR